MRCYDGGESAGDDESRRVVVSGDGEVVDVIALVDVVLGVALV